jgi:hypothetical protein
MDVMLGFLVFVLQGLAGSILMSRFYGSEMGKQAMLLSQSGLSTLTPSDPPACGLFKWSDYTIVSTRVVLPSGIQPAASRVLKKRCLHLSQFKADPQTGKHTLQAHLS